MYNYILCSRPVYVACIDTVQLPLKEQFPTVLMRILLTHCDRDRGGDGVVLYRTEEQTELNQFPHITWQLVLEGRGGQGCDYTTMM